MGQIKVKDDIQDQISNMIKSIEGSSTNEPEPTKSPSTDPPKSTEAPSTQAPQVATEAPPTQAPATSAPGTKAPTTDAPDERDKELEQLRQQLAEKDNELTELKKPKAPKTEAPPTELDFTKDLDLDEVTRDPAQLNKLLNRVRLDTRGEVFKSLPDLVKNQVAIIVALNQTSKDFYSSNPDLVAHKDAVGTVFDDLVKASPNKPLNELMTSVATESRKRLKLPAPKPQPKQPQPKPTPPARLPTKGHRAGRIDQKPSLEPLQADIEEMNKSLGR